MYRSSDGSSAILVSVAIADIEKLEKRNVFAFPFY